MVCKEDVCQWFRGLCGPKRIDLMSGLLQMCLPLEIRFIGSCVEDLARKNYLFLREAEIKANDVNEIRRLTNMLDEVTRSKLNVYLALLHSNNSLCSSLLFNTLTCVEPLQEYKKSKTSNQITLTRLAEEVLLLYTMAAYHPAFSFSQRHVLFERLDGVHSFLESEEQEKTSGDINPVSETPVAEEQSPPESTNSVHVVSIELKGSQKTPDRKMEFHLQVTWSDGKTSEVYKTYQALHDFHCELIKLFPKESGAHKQERQIPFLPQDRGISQVNNHTNKELTELIRKYIRQLALLPNHIIWCDHVTNFLQVPTSKKQQSPDVSSPLSPLNVKDTNEAIPSSHVKSLTIYNSNMTDNLSRKSVQDRSQGRGSNKVSNSAGTSSITSTSQKYVFTRSGTTPSPLSSPVQSPISSPLASPSASLHSRAISPGKFDITTWLKQTRLHKYTNGLSKYTLDELLQLTDNDLENNGLTQGARKKFHTEVGRLRDGLKNGKLLIETPGRAISPGSPWHSPPMTSCHLPPPSGNCSLSLPLSDTGRDFSPVPSNAHVVRHQLPPQSPAINKVLFSGNMSTASSMESSPACSEYSSPPHSPIPEQVKCQVESPLMDEVDREYENVAVKQNTKEKSCVPIGAIAESRLQAPPMHSAKQDIPTNNNNNTFVPIQNPVEIRQLTEVAAMQYSTGVPPVLPMDTPLNAHQMQMFYMHQHPPLRSPHPQMKPPLGASTIASMMPPPKLPMNGGTHIMYEKNHMMSISKAANSMEPPSLPSTLATMPTGSDSMSAYTKLLGYTLPNAMIPNPNGNGTSIASRPVSLGLPIQNTMVNNSVTYSVPCITSATSSVVENLNKVTNGTPMPNIQPMMVSHTSVVDSNAYVAHHTQLNSNSCNPPMYQSSPGQPAPSVPPLPGQGPAGPQPVIQMPGPNGSGAPLPQTMAGQALPNHGHVGTPPAMPNVGNSTLPPPPPGCSTCGCHGHCVGSSTTSSSTTNFQQFNVNMWGHQQHPMFPGYPALGIMPVTTNGLLPPNLSFSHPLPQMSMPPNGINPDLVYNNQPPNFGVIPPIDNVANSVFVSSASNSGYAGTHLGQMPQNQAEKGKAKTSHCYNCGNIGHNAIDCQESTMESMTHSGNYRLNLKPKSDSE